MAQFAQVLIPGVWWGLCDSQSDSMWVRTVMQVEALLQWVKKCRKTVQGDLQSWEPSFEGECSASLPLLTLALLGARQVKALTSATLHPTFGPINAAWETSEQEAHCPP